MRTQVDKKQENKSQSVVNAVTQKKNGGESTFQFMDNRPEAIAQRKHRKHQEMANNSPQVKQTAQLKTIADNHSAQQQPIQKKENNTGLPDTLKSGIENLSGHSMDDVKVHYNSDKPAQLQAHAYAQGTDIHLRPGQEKHLPHEAWHVVQQKQGRVKPTMQMKGGLNVNDDAGMEKEADIMGMKAATSNFDLRDTSHSQIDLMSNAKGETYQLAKKGKKKGKITGAIFGAAVGAAIASLFPSIGTIIGASVGGAIGSVALGIVGDKVTGTEAESNRKELGAAITPQIISEQKAWNKASNDNRKFIHGVTDYDNLIKAANSPSEEIKAQMVEKLRTPEVLHKLFVSTSLIDKGVVSDWTGSGLVLNVPKENIFAAASTDLSINNSAINEPSALIPEINDIRNRAKTQSDNRIERLKIEKKYTSGSKEADELDKRKRGPLPSPEEIIEDTGRGQHNEVAVLGKAPTGETVTGIGYYVLMSKDGKEITGGKLQTSKQRLNLLKELASLKSWPIYYINAACNENSIPSLSGDLREVGKIKE